MESTGEITGKQDIFLSADLQEAFIRDGYVVVDLLSAAEVAELTDCYLLQDIGPDDGGFYATMFHPDTEVKTDISNRITRTIGRRLSAYTRGYRPLFGNFIAKAGNNRHEVGIHQDWTYVDEARYRSFNVWTSLTPSNTRNGGMYMLSGSHHVDMPIRWTPFDSSIYDKYRSEIVRCSVPFDLKAGQAVIYDSAVIHFSSYNDTPDLRLACGCVFVPEGVIALHYWREGDELLVFEAPTSFFHNLVPGERPPGVPVRRLPVVRHFDEPAFRDLFADIDVS